MKISIETVRYFNRSLQIFTGIVCERNDPIIRRLFTSDVRIEHFGLGFRALGEFAFELDYGSFYVRF